MIKLIDGKIKTKYGCELCIHVDVCKFYSKAKELFNSNEFYEMNKYLEHNNNLKAWSSNKSCEKYLPFTMSRDLFELELKKEKSFLFTFDLFALVRGYVKDVLYNKHLEYFENEYDAMHNKYPNSINILNHCYKLSSTNHIFKISARDGSWEEKIELIDVLDYYKFFNK